MEYNIKKINIIFIILFLSQLGICKNDIKDYTFYYKSYHYEYTYNKLIQIPNNQILINNKNALITTINSSILSYTIDNTIPFNFFNDNTFNEISYKYSHNQPLLNSRRLQQQQAATATSKVTAASDAAHSWKLLLRLRDVNQGYFSKNLKNTGMENSHDLYQNTYSIIGQIKTPEHYKDPKDQKYAFKLIYTTLDGQTQTLIWKQSSWPASSTTITGYQPVTIPTQSKSTCTEFKGLAKSTDGSTYLDGNGNSGCWWNSVGSNQVYSNGIPGFNGKIAKSERLYIFKPPDSQAHKNFNELTTNTRKKDVLERGNLIGDKQLMTFEKAKLFCEFNYGDVISIKDANVNQDVLKLCRELGWNCWIGLQAPGNPKGWNDVQTWVNGQPYTYKNWSPGEPNNYGQNEKCAEIWNTGNWNDISCGSQKHAICAKVYTTEYDDDLVAVKKQMTFGNAIQWCKANYGSKANLATVKSFDQNANILKACQNTGVVEGEQQEGQGQETNCWIGLQPDSTQKFTKWNDEQKSEVNYKQWLTGFPKIQSGLDCAVMSVNKGTSGWINRICDEKAFFICSKGTNPATTTNQQTNNLNCPSGTTLIGGVGSLNDISGCGLETCDGRYSLTSIQACRDKCKGFANDKCKAFSWRSANDKTVCTLYESDVPTQKWGPNQIMCGMSVAGGYNMEQMDKLKQEHGKNMDEMNKQQQKGFENMQNQQKQHQTNLENKLKGMHKTHMNNLDKRMKEHRETFGKHMSGLKDQLLSEMKNSFNKNNEQTVLLQKIDDLKHQQTELELQHKMLQARKQQKKELTKQTNVILQKQLNWEKQRELQRQKRMAQRQKLLQQKHEMRLNEHYQLMNGLKGFLTAFKNVYGGVDASGLYKSTPNMPGMSMPASGGHHSKSTPNMPGYMSPIHGHKMPGQGYQAPRMMGGGVGDGAKRYETRYTKFAHFNRPPPLLPPIPPLPPGLRSKGMFMNQLQSIQGLTAPQQRQTGEDRAEFRQEFREQGSGGQLQNFMRGRRRLMGDLELYFMDISKCKFDIGFGELCMKYDYENDVVSFDIMVIEKKELKLETNKNDIMLKDMIDMDGMDDVFVDKDLVFFDFMKGNIGFNVWKYELMDWKGIQNENNNIVKYGKFDYFDNYIHHFIVYEYEFWINDLNDVECINDNNTLPFAICLKMYNENYVIYFENVDIFDRFGNDKLISYMQMLNGFELEWKNNEIWDEIIDFDQHIKKCVNLAIMKLCMDNKEVDLYVIEVKLQFINEIKNL